jgi:hypothetical protein
MTGRDSPSLCSRIALWNVELETRVEDFKNTFPGVNATVYDAAAVFNKVLDEPGKYGFQSSLSQGPSEDCLWYDFLHPNWPMQKILAQDFSEFLVNQINGDLK